MAQNPTGADTHEIPIGVFSGLCTYMSPSALPNGASPDCSDVAFAPGGFGQRPCFQKIFANPLYPTATRTYGKSYVDPTGKIRNLYFYSNGALTVEDPIAAPGVETLLSQTSAPNCYAKSVTAFGREYIAISDGLHGQEIPLQFDGVNLDRVTQDGPGAPPTVTSIIIPASLMPVTVAPLPTMTITNVSPDQRAFAGGYFTTINVYVTVPPDNPANAPVGSQVYISGTGTVFEGGPYPVILNPGPGGAITCSLVTPASTAPFIGSAILTVGASIPPSNVVMTRANNIVTVQTATAHQLQVGYQAQISNMQAGIVGGTISKIFINNEDLPGLATVTTTQPHGLVPQLFVSLTGILASAVGGSIVSAVRTGEVVTITTASPHGLSPGSLVTIAGCDASFNTTALVSAVLSTGTGSGSVSFTFGQVNTTDASSVALGTVSVNWPVPDTPTPSYFQVQAAPTPTTFQVQVFYPDGSWTGGTVAYAWDGNFFVQSVPTPTTFTYQQYGPDAIATAAQFVPGTTGTVTPYGQAAPGKHQCQVSFLTRQGYITAPCPPVTFVANGGQYISVTNLPIGPSNIVARIVEFTGAQGAYFFYIPATPQENGQVVGTATQINDNVTQSAVFDFGDNTLFRATATSIAGNNLANQLVIDSAIGFGSYGSRLITYGQRNIVQGGDGAGGLLNLGFDGGYLPSNPTIPAGWTSYDNFGAIKPGHYGFGWQITVSAGSGNVGKLSQPFFQNYLGNPIAQPNTFYRLRLWLKPSAIVNDLVFEMAISSVSTGFSSVATIPGSFMSTAGSWIEAAFGQIMPDPIPSDLILQLFANSPTLNVTLTVDEINIIFSEDPYATGFLMSYVDNPEAFDGVTGVSGPDDEHPVLDLGIIRNNLYALTQDPSGRLHETSQGNTEPAEWVWNEVAANCGTVSAFSLTRSQADDASAAGGEEFFAWFSSTGVRIFGGESPDKISQEIQRPTGAKFPGVPPDLGALNAAAQLTVWGLNDPDQKVMWWGIPTGTATAPNVIYSLSYLGLDSAGAIVANPPIHKSLSGKLVATDLGRKWAPWQRPMNGAALMYRSTGEIQPVFFGGNGQAPGVSPGFGNAYILNQNQFTDDDYGAMFPYYTTYAIPGRDEEQQLQLGGHMKLFAYHHCFVAGYGTLTIQILYESLTHAWPLTGVYLLQSDPQFDLEWGGGNAQGHRFFLRYAVTPNPAGTSPLPATDTAFNLTSIVAALKQAKRMLVRGVYP